MTDRCVLWDALMSLLGPGLEGIEIKIRSDFEGNGVASETWELVWEVYDPVTGFRRTSFRSPGREKSLAKAIADARRARLEKREAK